MNSKKPKWKKTGLNAPYGEIMTMFCPFCKSDLDMRENYETDDIEGNDKINIVARCSFCKREYVLNYELKNIDFTGYFTFPG